MVWSMEDEEAGDLTSLAWLHNLNIMASVPPTPPSSPRPQSLQATLGKRSPALRLTLNPSVAEEYRTCDKKPPFSYATLICMAMKANQNKMTLSAIYSWIRENFMFFRKADPSWQNSIRHNLSLNKCFVKVAREKNEPGKGGFWRLDLDRLEEGHRSRRARVNGGSRRGRGRSKKCTVGIEEEAAPRDEGLGLLARDVMLSGPSVVVESVEPPVSEATSADEELAAIVWGSSPPSWDDTQLDLLHSLLDSL